MKNIRIIVVALFCLIAAIILCMAWIDNSYDLEFGLEKSTSLEAAMYYEVKNSNDIDLIKQKYFELDEIRLANKKEKNRIVGRNMVSFASAFAFLFVCLILLVIELYNRRKAWKNVAVGGS